MRHIAKLPVSTLTMVDQTKILKKCHAIQNYFLAFKLLLGFVANPFGAVLGVVFVILFFRICLKLLVSVVDGAAGVDDAVVVPG